MSRIAIIPARGGSKRIPKKNIKDFCGRPMIIHILEELRNACIFDEIHVSTDDPEIFSIVSSHGFKPDFFRPHELGGDYEPLSSVINYVLRHFLINGITFDTVGLFFPTAPLLTADLIKNAVFFHEKNIHKGQLLSVSKYPVPIEWGMFMDSISGQLTIINPDKVDARSQDLNDAWYETGGFVIYDYYSAMNNSGGKWGYPIPKHLSVDIDQDEDWILAEFLYRYKNKIAS